MKNQYVGDINDYRKYGLLRCLQRAGGFEILVAWMLTPDDHGPDGAKRGYLDQRGRWRQFDPELFDWLSAHIHATGQRSVKLIEQSGLLPRSGFMDAVVPDREERRSQWSKALLEASAGKDLVFLDPDTGIEVASRPGGTRGSSRYVLWDEIVSLWNTGCSLLIYQHFPRKQREVFTREIVSEIRARAPGAEVATFTTSHVLFVLACQARHATVLGRLLGEVEAAWPGELVTDRDLGGPAATSKPAPQAAAFPVSADPNGQVRTALEELKPHLVAFVRRAFEAAGQQPPPFGRHRGAVDTYVLLSTCLGNRPVFDRWLTPTERNYIHEVKDIRNRLAHDHKFNATEARRAVDTVQLVIAGIHGWLTGCALT